MNGFVYILECDAMPGLLKIGKTERHPRERAIELSLASGLPDPLRLVKAFPVRDADAAERICHEILHPHRHAANREFFRTTILHAAAMLEVILLQEGMLDDALCIDSVETSRRLEELEAVIATQGETLEKDENAKAREILELRVKVKELSDTVEVLRQELPPKGTIDRLKGIINDMGAERERLEKQVRSLQGELASSRAELEGRKARDASWDMLQLYLKNAQERIALLEEKLKSK
jgi:predicted RNase H-like nuclease (RuvC/YqgF family)